MTGTSHGFVFAEYILFAHESKKFRGNDCKGTWYITNLSQQHSYYKNLHITEHCVNIPIYHVSHLASAGLIHSQTTIDHSLRSAKGVQIWQQPSGKGSVQRFG